MYSSSVRCLLLSGSNFCGRARGARALGGAPRRAHGRGRRRAGRAAGPRRARARACAHVHHRGDRGRVEGEPRLLQRAGHLVLRHGAGGGGALARAHARDGAGARVPNVWVARPLPRASSAGGMHAPPPGPGGGGAPATACRWRLCQSRGSSSGPAGAGVVGVGCPRSICGRGGEAHALRPGGAPLGGARGAGGARAAAAPRARTHARACARARAPRGARTLTRKLCRRWNSS